VGSAGALGRQTGHRGRDISRARSIAPGYDLIVHETPEQTIDSIAAVASGR
jgi:hypothetical protein